MLHDMENARVFHDAMAELYWFNMTAVIIWPFEDNSLNPIPIIPVTQQRGHN